MKNIAAFPLLALALTACNPYYNTGSEPYPQGPQGYPDQGYSPYPGQGYPDPGPPMPPGGPVYPGPGQGAPYPAPSQPAYPAPAPPYPQPGYSVPGAPQGLPVVNLTGTNWRVLSINGTRTPTSNFYVNFMPGQVGAKFGCNSMSGNYTQAGSILSVGAIAATRMACPDMSFENQGSRILQMPLTISGLGERVTLSNDRGTIELVRAR